MVLPAVHQGEDRAGEGEARAGSARALEESVPTRRVMQSKRRPRVRNSQADEPLARRLHLGLSRTRSEKPLPFDGAVGEEVASVDCATWSAGLTRRTREDARAQLEDGAEGW